MSQEVNLLQTKTVGRVIYAIDASSANKKNRTGVENYAFHLIQHLKDHAHGEDERVILYSSNKLEGDLATLPNGWESKVVSWKSSKGWMQGAMSLELAKNKPSVFFVPSQGLPRQFPFVKYPILTTIHDVGFKRLPKLYSNSERKRQLSSIKRSIKKAKHLLTISEFSKAEIQEFYKVKDEKLTVVPLAADTNIFKKMEQADVNVVLNKHRLGHSFFLVVGRMEKKKNTEMILRAFQQFKSTRGIGDPFEIVLVGDPGFGFNIIKQYFEHSQAKESIRVLGHVPDNELAALMNSADAYLFPSLYEGFGIPSLEAMQCGTVLMVSDIPIHHEVAQEAAIYVPPANADQWAKQMKTIVEDTTLRESLIEKGFERAKNYSWKQTAEKTWEVLQSLV